MNHHPPCPSCDIPRRRRDLVTPHPDTDLVEAVAEAARRRTLVALLERRPEAHRCRPSRPRTPGGERRMRNENDRLWVASLAAIVITLATLAAVLLNRGVPT